MADDIEKFVMEYTVVTNDSIKRLEDLQQRTERLRNSQVQGGKQFKLFGKDMNDALAKIIPGFNNVNNLLGGMTRGMVTATATATAFLVVLGAVYRLQKEYEAQRLTAWNIGTSPLQVEQYQRQFSSSSGGVMRNTGSRALLEKISTMSVSAYTQVDPNNMDALKLRNAGTSAYDGTKYKSIEKQLDEMSKKFQSVSKETANAIGQSIGLTQDETQAIRGRSAAVIAATKLTDEQTTKIYIANQAMESLRNSQGQAMEAVRRFAQVIGQFFAPAIANFVSYLAQAAVEVEGILDRVAGGDAMQKISRADDLYMNFFKSLSDRSKDASRPKDAFGALGAILKETVGMSDSDEAARNKQKEQAAEMAKKQKDAADQQFKAMTQFTKDMNLFAASVGTFSDAIDDKMGWAAWAGAAGEAGGLRGMGTGKVGIAAASGGANANVAGGYSTSPGGSTSYNFGNIRKDENSFREYGSAQEGMTAQKNQLMRYFTGKTTGKELQTLNDILYTWAPPKNSKGGFENNTEAYIKFMSDKLQIGRNAKLNLNDPEVMGKFMYWQARMEKSAKTMNGYTENDFINGAKGQYTGGVGDITKGTGVTNYATDRNSVQARLVQQTVAGIMGISVGQLNSGRVNFGDADFALGKVKFDAENNVKKLEAKIASGQALGGQAASLPRDLRIARQFLANVNTYGASIVGNTNGNRERALTGDMPDPTLRYKVDIYIDGSKSPAATGAAVKSALDGTVNNANTTQSQ